MATLYEIDADILSCIDTETGEILDVDRLDALQMERADKIERVALLYKNIVADMKAYKAEKDHFAKLEKQAMSKVKSLKDYLAYATAGQDFKSVRVAISYRKSEKLIVDDLAQVAPEFVIYDEPRADKEAITKALKDGKEVAGVHIEESRNIQIK